MDRILEQFSRRYFELNPYSVYGNADVVHIVAYTLLLLNTDLHVVDSSSRMTRNQFVKNTMTAITAQHRIDSYASTTNASTSRTSFVDTSSIMEEPTSYTNGIQGNDETDRWHNGDVRNRGQRSGSVASHRSLPRENQATISTPNLHNTSPTKNLSLTSGYFSTKSRKTGSLSNISSYAANNRSKEAELESLLKVTTYSYYTVGS